MPAPLVGRKFGVNVIMVPDQDTCRQIQVLGLSGSSRQQPGMSKSEKLLQRALDRFAGFGCETRFLRLKDLMIHDCEGN
jgi:hypothetical protein